MHDNAAVWRQTRTRPGVAETDFLLKQRNEDRSFVSGQRLHAEYSRENGADYRRFDDKEIATIRMLEMELVAADLSRRMSSMHETMRLLSCETRQLARRVNDGRRQSVRTASRREAHGDDDEAESSADVRDDTQKELLSEVIGDLKSVSVLMSSTLQLLTSSDRAARNNNNIKSPKAALDEVYELRTADSHRHLVCSRATASDDKENDEHYEHYDKSDDTYTTEVCKKDMFSIRICCCFLCRLCNWRYRLATAWYRQVDRWLDIDGPISKEVGLHTAGEVWYLRLPCYHMHTCIHASTNENIWHVFCITLCKVDQIYNTRGIQFQWKLTKNFGRRVPPESDG